MTLLVVLAVAVACAVADRVDLGYYVITPGVAQPVAPLVKVPPAREHTLDGAVFLTDVYITRVTALSYLFDKIRPNAQMVPAAAVLGPATPPSQLVTQGYLEMAQSQDAARAAALSRLGYHVKARNAGTLVFAVVPGSPASTVLSVGQIVTAVDGASTANACAFAQALARHAAGQRVTLSVEKSQVSSRAVIAPGQTVRRTVRLARWPSTVPRPATPSCPLASSSHPGYLGVEAETYADYAFPFPISLTTTSIGGPSAGLAMTLGIIDELGSGHLTGGRRVAATGTITPAGNVGQVGGVPQKTVAVEDAGATVFFVPAAQAATARSKATPSLRVYGVRSLAQVLRILRRLGGTVPSGHGSPAAASRGS